MKPVISVIIPTWNNQQFLDPCIRSIYGSYICASGFAELIIVNNGRQPCKEQYGHLKNVKVVDSPRTKIGEPANLGWEGGLKLGLEHSEASFVCFQNDDTFLPKTSYLAYEKMLVPFSDKNVACVGPVTTTAAGIQSIYHPRCPIIAVETTWVIFFCAMIRREHLDLVGGVDTSLPGGDDLDLCIRFRKTGKKVIVTPDAFLIHHGFQTGTRVHGDHNKPGGWNSRQMIDRTNHALIQKHGFKIFFENVCNQNYKVDIGPFIDKEGDSIRAAIGNMDSLRVLEVGCGGQKTLPGSIGMDLVPVGEQVPIFHGMGMKSAADVVGDIQESLPFGRSEFDIIIARHILEHCVDIVGTLANWSQVLKPGGRLVIAVPNQDLVNTIPMSPDHVHAFSPTSLSKLMALLGFSHLSTIDPQNGISFVQIFEKNKQSNGLDRLYEGDVTTIPYADVID